MRTPGFKSDDGGDDDDEKKKVVDHREESDSSDDDDSSDDGDDSDGKRITAKIVKVEPKLRKRKKDEEEQKDPKVVVDQSLKMMNPECYEGYDDWLKIMICCKNIEDSKSCQKLFIEWCRGMSNFDIDEIKEKWKTIDTRHHSKCGMGTLIYERRRFIKRTKSFDEKIFQKISIPGDALYYFNIYHLYISEIQKDIAVTYDSEGNLTGYKELGEKDFQKYYGHFSSNQSQ